MVFDVNNMVLNRKHDYEWGTIHYAVDANVVGGVVEYLEEKNGNITNEAFLEYSRDKSSPTHSMINWNDSECAERYRLDQCRRIINSLQVKVTLRSVESKPKKVSAYVNVNESSRAKKAKYNFIVNALEDTESREHIINRMYRDMKAFAERYEIYSEAAEVVQAINNTLKAR